MMDNKYLLLAILATAVTVHGFVPLHTRITSTFAHQKRTAPTVRIEINEAPSSSRPLLLRRGSFCNRHTATASCRAAAVNGVSSAAAGASSTKQSKATALLQCFLVPAVRSMSPTIAGGMLAGGLHAVSGPDHLAALVPPSIGRPGWYGARIGAIWGFGHGVSAMILGLCAFFLKDRIAMMHLGIFQKLSVVAESAVGASLLAIGVLGIIENYDGHSIENGGGGAAARSELQLPDTELEEVRETVDDAASAAGDVVVEGAQSVDGLVEEGQAAAAAASGSGSSSSRNSVSGSGSDSFGGLSDSSGVVGAAVSREGEGAVDQSGDATVASTAADAVQVIKNQAVNIATTTASTIAAPAAIAKKKKVVSSNAIFANGLLHGFSWDGAPSLAPAIAYSSWRSAVLFLLSYGLGTMFTMSATAGTLGELSMRLGKAANNPDIPRKLSIASSVMAMAIGVFWIAQATIFR